MDIHTKKIEFKWFYFILFNLFRLKPIKTDFVLTTLATRSDNNWQKRHISHIRNQCRFWSRVATYLIDPSKQSQHDSARVGTSNAKAGPNMDARKGFIPAIIGSTSRWRLAVRAKGPLAEDDMGELWNWNESAQLTTQDSGIQNATKTQRIVESNVFFCHVFKYIKSDFFDWFCFFWSFCCWFYTSFHTRSSMSPMSR